MICIVVMRAVWLTLLALAPPNFLCLLQAAQDILIIRHTRCFGSSVSTRIFPSLDPFLRLQAFSYWSQSSPQFVVPNSQKGVFASNGYTGYWRRIQKSFVNYVGSSTIRETPNLSISFAPTSNRRLSLPTLRLFPLL